MLVRAVWKNSGLIGCAASPQELDEMLKTAIRRDEKTSEERDALIAGGDVDSIAVQEWDDTLDTISAAPLLSWAIQKGWTYSAVAVLNGGADLVTRDRADHHLTEISYIYTFFAHDLMYPCTGSPCYAYTDRDTLYERERM